MKLKNIFCVVIAFLFHILSFAQKENTVRTIKGTWNYDIAYDTFAVATINIDGTSINMVDTSDAYPTFIHRLKIKRKKAVLFDGSKKLKATWDINDSNQITFFIKDGRILRYAITKLTFNSLELRQLKEQGGTLGYRKK